MRDARILLIEDEAVIRDQLALVLRREGAHVSTAGDGADGLRLFQFESFDLVIADVCMPKIGGFGVFAALRFGVDGDPAVYGDTPVILISGATSRDELSRALDAGVDDFMQKPIDHVELRARVRAVLRRSRAMAAPQGSTAGSLRDFGASSLTQALHLSNRTGRLRIRCASTHAVLDFRYGMLSHALFEAPGITLEGEEAAVMALTLERGSFEFLALPKSAPRTVFAETQHLLLDAVKRLDESASQTGDRSGEAAEAAEAAAIQLSIHDIVPPVDDHVDLEPGPEAPQTTSLIRMGDEDDVPTTGSVHEFLRDDTHTGEVEEIDLDEEEEDEEDFDPTVTFDLGLPARSAREAQKRRQVG